MSADVDISASLRQLDAVADIMTDKKNKIMPLAKKLAESDTSAAFSRAADPYTGVPWKPRKHDYPWPMLNKTGTLKSLLSASTGRMGGNPRVYINVADASITGRTRTSRTGVHGVSYHVVANTMFYGRTTGNKGHLPPRPYAGISESSRKQVARLADDLIGRTNNV